MHKTESLCICVVLFNYIAGWHAWFTADAIRQQFLPTGKGGIYNITGFKSLFRVSVLYLSISFSVLLLLPTFVHSISNLYSLLHVWYFCLNVKQTLLIYHSCCCQYRMWILLHVGYVYNYLSQQVVISGKRLFLCVPQSLFLPLWAPSVQSNPIKWCCSSYLKLWGASSATV